MYIQKTIINKKQHQNNIYKVQFCLFIMKKTMVILLFGFFLFAINLVSAETLCGNSIAPEGCNVVGNNLECTLSDGMVDDIILGNWPGVSGDKDYLWLGCTSVKGYSTKIYFKINNIENYPPATKAIIKLWNDLVRLQSNVTIQKITSDWSESSTTAPTFDSQIVNSVYFYNSGIPKWREFDISSIYNQWKSGVENYGFRIADKGCPSAGAVEGRNMFSSENSDAEHRPKLILENACIVRIETNCTNLEDDDGDGETDCNDKNCFSSSYCIPLAMSWKNMNNTLIDGADLGDYVMMVAEDVVGASAGEEVKFSIYEYDESLLDFDDDIRVGSNAISGKVNSNGDAVAYWKITSEDLSKTNGDYSEFYFKTDKSTGESSKLNIRNSINDDELKIQVVSPSCGSDLPFGTNSQVTIEAFDLDDFISGNVLVNEILIGNFEGNGEYSFDYDLSDPGNIQIRADVNNSRQVLRSSVSNIMVTDLYDEGAKYVAACIDNPKNYGEFEQALIFFNASSTRALEVVSGTLKEITKDKLFFKWVFSDGKTISSTELSNYPGIEASDLYNGFNKRFGGAGKNLGTLTVSFV